MTGSNPSQIFLLTIGVIVASASTASDDFFEQRIRPVLVEHCYRCHSAETTVLKGGLRVDAGGHLAKGGASGMPAVTPGDPARSHLLDAIRYTNPDLQMPPDGALPAHVVADFEAWIAAGAQFPEALAAQDVAPDPDDHWAFAPPSPRDVPAVSDTAWPKTDIDRFVLARMEGAGLTPSPEADRRTLIRRLSYDLLGLPPTAEEVTAFVADPDPQAYEKLVDRYLASPHYGERWARHWLDVARYADTKGYVYGGREEGAFTHSYVYRDWVVNALNNDMAYDRFVRMQLAADQLPDEATRDDLAAMGFLTLGQRYLGVLPDIIDDRIDTVTRGLMGLTVSCARCHDHKFDPVPIEDYYSLYGVFSASSERTVPIRPAAIEEPQYAEFAEEMATRQDALKAEFQKRSDELAARLRGQIDRYLAAVPAADDLPTDDFYEIRNAEDLNPTIVRRWAAYIARHGEEDAVFGPWNRAASSTEGEAFLDTTGANTVIAHTLNELAPTNALELASAYGTLFKTVNDEWLAAVAAAEEAGADAPVAFTEPDREAIRAVLYDPASPVVVPDGAIVDLEWMFDESARVELGRLNAEIDRWIIKAPEAPRYAVVLVDKPEPPQAKVFKRGNPAMPGPDVPRQFLELLEGEQRSPFLGGSGRAEMAEAITRPDNPLTARVIVNRIWGWHFGSYLVDTPSDFGMRSADPTHPELLDWLALRFVESGWSWKALHRDIVLSATYRQSSDVAVSAPGLESDPTNRYLWHFNRRRLDFESLRDALLATSGQLDDSLGGRPVELTEMPWPTRRTLYGRIDRQFLPAVFRVFDFPSPDMHSPQRLDTTVPQQALFLLNNRFVQDEARAFAARAEEACAADRERAAWMYARAYQRAATDDEVDRAVAFVRDAITPPPPPKVEPSSWLYGYGKVGESGGVESFADLPHFTGSAYQGGPSWPDGTLGWAQITAEGGHPGNTLDHAIVRRWTAPVSGTATITGRIHHQRSEGDGIRCRVVSSRHGQLGQWRVHNNDADTNFYALPVEAGDTIDFIVDIFEVLNSDEHEWAPVVEVAQEADAKRYDAKADFGAPFVAPPIPMQPWEKLAQVLLSSNEFLFVD